jgi:hypothetical protein
VSKVFQTKIHFSPRRRPNGCSIVSKLIAPTPDTTASPPKSSGATSATSTFGASPSSSAVRPPRDTHLLTSSPLSWWKVWAIRRVMRSSWQPRLPFLHLSLHSLSLSSLTGRGHLPLLLCSQRVSPSLGSAWCVCSFTIFHQSPLILFVQTAFHTNSSVRYAGVFLGSASATANTPGILGYMLCNIAGQSKRAFTTAIAIGGGGIGGIIASTVFRAQDAPGFRPGRK